MNGGNPEKWLGTKLKAVRATFGLTQKDVCQGICDRSLLSQIENGKVIPSLSLLNNLCSRLGIGLTDVLVEHELSEEAKHALEQLNDLISDRFLTDAGRFGKQMLRLVHIRRNPYALCECLRLIGFAYHCNGQYPDALPLFKTAYEASVQLGSVILFNCANSYASVLINMSRLTEGYTILQEVYRLTSLVPIHDATKIRVLYNMAKVARQHGKLIDARRFVQEGLRLCRRTNISDCAGHLETLNGLIQLDECHIKGAKDSFERALYIYQFNQDKQSVVGCLTNLAECFFLLRDTSSSKTVLKNALSLIENDEELFSLLPLVMQTMSKVRLKR